MRKEDIIATFKRYTSIHMSGTLQRRAESAVNTAKKWENDKTLLAEIRSSIPFKELVPELVCDVDNQCRSYINSTKVEDCKDDIQYKTECFKEDDIDWEGDDLLLKRLTIYFKKEIMSWCNQP